MKYTMQFPFRGLLHRATKLICYALLGVWAHAALGQQVLLSGTSFDPVSGDTSKYYWANDEIVYYGMQVGRLTITPTITPDANANTFHTNHHYAITNNPAKLDKKRYVSLVGMQSDNQLVFSKMPAGARLLEYTVEGAKPYTDIKVKVSYCYVKKVGGGCGQFNGFNSVQTQVNPNQSNTANGKDWPYASNSEFCGVIDDNTVANSGIMAQPMADGSVKVYIKNNGQALQAIDTCKVLAIKSIEVWGTPKPRLQPIESEICTKESIDLLTKQPYNSVTYQWQVQIGNSSSWTNLGTKSSETYEPQTNDTYKFRLEMKTTSAPVQTFYSDTLITLSDACCTLNGQPAARKRLFHDDFGRLDPSDPTGHTYIVTDYTDIRNPKVVTRTSPDQERWPAVPPPVGLTYDNTRVSPINDGEYMVVANLNDANVGYANNITGAGDPVQGYDHSGTKEGALLMMNLRPSNFGNVLYERNFSGLCENKQVYFEAWATVFTGDPGINIIAEITDVVSGNKISDNLIIEPISKPLGQLTGWQKVSGKLNLTGTNPALNFKIINNNTTTSTAGNDLVLDDIEIKVCAPPSLDLYFDDVLLNKQVSACNLDKINLKAKPSSLLNGYYGNNTRYIYQWSKTPNDTASWKNINNTPITATEFLDLKANGLHAELTADKPTGPIYFRAIAASPAIFTTNNNFLAPKYANPNDPCADYTISSPIEFDVSCTLPLTWLYFKGERTTIGNRLEWATAKEINNAVFRILKSKDGIQYYEIGTVAPRKSAGVSNYVFYDENASSAYYRILQVDNDGLSNSSKVIYLRNEENHEQGEIYVFPNPNTGTFKVSGFESNANIEVIDNQGKVVGSYRSSESNLIEISLPESGIYMVKLSSESGVVTKKVVVH